FGVGLAQGELADLLRGLVLVAGGRGGRAVAIAALASAEPEREREPGCGEGDRHPYALHERHAASPSCAASALAVCDAPRQWSYIQIHSAGFSRTSRSRSRAISAVDCQRASGAAPRSASGPPSVTTNRRQPTRAIPPTISAAPVRRASFAGPTGIQAGCPNSGTQTPSDLRA